MEPIELRETMPALESSVYCNWGAVGPSPRRVVEVAESALEHHEYEAPAAEGMYPAAFDAVDDPERTVERLAEQGIVIRNLPNPDAIRASIHAFNSRADVDALLEALGEEFR